MLKGYEVKERMEDGRLYAVVELEDGSTFGQIIDRAATVEELELKIKEAVDRVTAGDSVSEVDSIIGVYRAVEAPAERRE